MASSVSQRNHRPRCFWTASAKLHIETKFWIGANILILIRSCEKFKNFLSMRGKIIFWAICLLLQNNCLWKILIFFFSFCSLVILMKNQFWKKSLWKNATLSSWTLFHHICPHFWEWLLLYSAITPKSEDKYVLKAFNSTELHFSEVYFFQNWSFSYIYKFDWL